MTDYTRADQRKFHYIYRINRHDGKYYIGLHSTDNLDDGYFGSGTLLAKSIHKHGKSNHIKSILGFYESRKILREQEELLVNAITLKDPMCLNLVLGGACGTLGLKRMPMSKETKTKLSEAQKKRSAESRKHSEKTKSKIASSNKGKTKSAEHLSKIVASKKASKELAPETYGKWRARGKPKTEEEKMNLSKKSKQFWALPENKEKQSIVGKASWSLERREAASARAKAKWELFRSTRAESTF